MSIKTKRNTYWHCDRCCMTFNDHDYAMAHQQEHDKKDDCKLPLDKYALELFNVGEVLIKRYCNFCGKEELRLVQLDSVHLKTLFEESD